MLTMATERPTRHYFQTFQWLKNQYTAWAANMRATKTYASRQGHTSNDAIGNALFMWAREQDAEQLARLLEPYLNRFQEIWGEKDEAETTGKAWLPGAVRDQASLNSTARPRDRKRTGGEYGKGDSLKDDPKKGKGKGTG